MDHIVYAFFNTSLTFPRVTVNMSKLNEKFYFEKNE